MEKLPELLRSHFEDPYHRGQCDRATLGSQSHDPDSQHFILIQLRVDDEGTIEEAWFESQGCVYCEAPASILAQYCESKSIKELNGLDGARYLALTQLDQVSAPACSLLALTALQDAMSADIEDDESHPLFGGPSLGEES